MAFFDDVDVKLSNLINSGAGKAKDMSETFRISGAIKDEERKQEELYRQLGKYYYDNYSDMAEGQVKVWCDDIKASEILKLQYQNQINKLKGTVTCPGCGAEVAEGAMFCSTCGMKMQPHQNKNIVEKAERTCPACGNIVDQDAMFCTSCGQRLPEQLETEENKEEELEQEKKQCPRCGAFIEADQLFCTACGQKITEQKEDDMISGDGGEVAFEEISSASPEDPEPLEKAEKPEVCPMCGHELKPEQKFCTNCGTKIEK